MNKVILYVESLPTNRNQLVFDFCYSAKCGAVEKDIPVRSFNDISVVDGYPTNVIVGSVEACKQWLSTYGYVVPAAIDLFSFKAFLGREVWLDTIDNIDTFPVFIKPYEDIKAFTGTVVENKEEIDLFAEGYEGKVIAQEVVEFASEYRVYIANGRLLGCKHYLGDSLLFPDRSKIEKCIEHANTFIDHHSYTLDFGVTDNGDTMLVEPNDGWAIGNYGLAADKYWLFLRNRWFQMTGLRKKMDIY